MFFQALWLILFFIKEREVIPKGITSRHIIKLRNIEKKLNISKDSGFLKNVGKNRFPYSLLWPKRNIQPIIESSPLMALKFLVYLKELLREPVYITIVNKIKERVPVEPIDRIYLNISGRELKKFIFKRLKEKKLKSKQST